MRHYSIILPRETLVRASDYLHTLKTGQSIPGDLLRNQLADSEISSLSPLELLGGLFDTKSPQIFAEFAVCGDGSDWNLTELGLLGDISVATPITVFDNGNHDSPRIHTPPFSGVLVFTPGALLRNGHGFTPADWDEVTASDANVSTEGFFELYRRRLLPVLRFINDHAHKSRSAFVTIPGIGCGQFAGQFRGQLGLRIQIVLERLLDEYANDLPNINCVYFDPYGECENYRSDIHGISLMVRPLLRPGNHDKSQLCHPSTYAEKGDDFSECGLYSIVAWDHVSWPGNDFYAGSRATDDGVKAAATSSMAAITGVTGDYDDSTNTYLPPRPYANWGEVVETNIRKRTLRLWNPEAIWQR